VLASAVTPGPFSSPASAGAHYACYGSGGPGDKINMVGEVPS